MKNLYELLVAGKEKAIVGFAVSGLITLLAMLNISGDMTVEQALTVIVTAVLTGASVYVKRNKN